MTEDERNTIARMVTVAAELARDDVRGTANAEDDDVVIGMLARRGLPIDGPMLVDVRLMALSLRNLVADFANVGTKRH